MTDPMTLSEDDFEERYSPVYIDDNAIVPLRGPKADRMRATIDEHHVWTLVDTASGAIYALPGYHMVNAVDYITTEVRWTDADRDAGLQAIWLDAPTED